MIESLPQPEYSTYVLSSTVEIRDKVYTYAVVFEEPISLMALAFELQISDTAELPGDPYTGGLINPDFESCTVKDEAVELFIAKNGFKIDVLSLCHTSDCDTRRGSRDDPLLRQIRDGLHNLQIDFSTEPIFGLIPLEDQLHYIEHYLSATTITYNLCTLKSHWENDQGPRSQRFHATVSELKCVLLSWLRKLFGPSLVPQENCKAEFWVEVHDDKFSYVPAERFQLHGQQNPDDAIDEDKVGE